MVTWETTVTARFGVSPTAFGCIPGRTSVVDTAPSCQHTFCLEITQAVWSRGKSTDLRGSKSGFESRRCLSFFYDVILIRF